MDQRDSSEEVTGNINKETFCKLVLLIEVIHLNESKSIKAVTFDNWQTLMLEKDGWSAKRRNARCKNLARALDKMGLEISNNRFESAFKELYSWLKGIWKENKEVTHLDHIKFLVEAVSEGPVKLDSEEIDQLSSAYVSATFEVPPYLNPDAREVLNWLKERDNRIGLICNIGLTPGIGLREFLEREGVAEYFDLMIFSDEVGIRKPEPQIFRKVTDELQLDPSEIVHIGDNLKNDIWGAKNAGFKAIHLRTEVGRDKIAESDPTSLISTSRKLENQVKEQIIPDKTITSLSEAIGAIKDLEG